MLTLSFVEFKKGSYVLVDGVDTNDRFFIVKTGKVACSNSMDPGRKSNKILKPGDFVGVIPCMSGHSQIENAIAMEDCTMISVARDQYPDLIKQNVPVAMKIIRTFSNRMREMNEQLTQLTLRDTSATSKEQIYNVALYYDNAGFRDIASYAYYRYLKEYPVGKNIPMAQKRFVSLKSASKAVYYEPSHEMVRNYPAGTMIMAETQSAQEMYVIQEGSVKITKVVNGNEVILSVLHRGDMFGEMALLENKGRSANAIAHESCRLMVINRENFDHMVGTQPQLIARLTTMLAERLWSMYRQLYNTCLKDYLHRAIDMLALQLEKERRFRGSFQTSITPQELLTMCAIPKRDQVQGLVKLEGEKSIKLIDGKIFVPDCQEIIRLSALFKKIESGEK